jgi:Flp pilus assembly pilin Flp
VSTEYTLLALFIGIAALVAILLFGGTVLGLFESGNNEVPWDSVP